MDPVLTSSTLRWLPDLRRASTSRRSRGYAGVRGVVVSVASISASRHFREGALVSCGTLLSLGLGVYVGFRVQEWDLEPVVLLFSAKPEGLLKVLSSFWCQRRS